MLYALDEAAILLPQDYGGGSLNFRVRHLDESGTTLSPDYLGTRDPNRYVEAVAPDAISGRDFWRWEDDGGTVLGYNPTMALNLTWDEGYVARYTSVEQDPPVPVIVITRVEGLYEDGKGKLRGSAFRCVPAGYRVVEQGMLYTSNKTIAEERYVYGTSGVNRYVGSDTASIGSTSLRIVPLRNTVKIGFRGYMDVEDEATGVVTTYYSHVEYATYKNLAETNANVYFDDTMAVVFPSFTGSSPLSSGDRVAPYTGLYVRGCASGYSSYGFTANTGTAYDASTVFASGTCTDGAPAFVCKAPNSSVYIDVTPIS